MKATDQGQLYFLHKATGQSTWHDPRVPRNVPLRDLLGNGEGDTRSDEELMGVLASGWERRFTESGRTKNTRRHVLLFVVNYGVIIGHFV